MRKEMDNAPVGTSFAVPVVHALGHVYLRADLVTAMTNPFGEVELSIQQLQGFVSSQTFTIGPAMTDGPPEAKSMQLGVMDSDTRIAELGILRMPIPIAIETAAILLEQLLKTGVPAAHLRERLAKIAALSGEAA